MKALTVEKAQEIRAGKGHYHWICRDWANFTSILQVKHIVLMQQPEQQLCSCSEISSSCR